MASGETLLELHPRSASIPSTGYGTPDTRNGHPVIDFDDSTDQSVIFECIMPRGYDSGGITVYIHWSASSAITGNCVLVISLERVGDGQQDIDSDGFAAANSVTDAAPGTSGHVTIASVTFTDGADMDSVAVGEKFRLKMGRDADNASDTLSGDIELNFIEIKET